MLITPSSTRLPEESVISTQALYHQRLQSAGNSVSPRSMRQAPPRLVAPESGRKNRVVIEPPQYWAHAREPEPVSAASPIRTSAAHSRPKRTDLFIHYSLRVGC